MSRQQQGLPFEAERLVKIVFAAAAVVLVGTVI
jgi:hypothetical protein